MVRCFECCYANLKWSLTCCKSPKNAQYTEPYKSAHNTRNLGHLVDGLLLPKGGSHTPRLEPKSQCGKYMLITNEQEHCEGVIPSLEVEDRQLAVGQLPLEVDSVVQVEHLLGGHREHVWLHEPALPELCISSNKHVISAA